MESAIELNVYVVQITEFDWNRSFFLAMHAWGIIAECEQDDLERGWKKAEFNCTKGKII